MNKKGYKAKHYCVRGHAPDAAAIPKENNDTHEGVNSITSANKTAPLSRVSPPSEAASTVTVPADPRVHPLIHAHGLAYVGGAAQEDGLGEAGRRFLEDDLADLVALGLGCG